MDLAALDRCPRPRRVAVIGCSGSGKSTLARQLAPVLELPLIHLDREYWGPGWDEPSRDVWVPRHDALLAAERWLMDGNYGGTMRQRVAAAELVVVLERPSLLLLWRVLARTVRHHGRSRPDMGEGCVERFTGKQNLAFYRYVLGYNARRRPAVRRLLAELVPDRHVVVRSRRNARKLIARAAAVR